MPDEVATAYGVPNFVAAPRVALSTIESLCQYHTEFLANAATMASISSFRSEADGVASESFGSAFQLSPTELRFVLSCLPRGAPTCKALLK